MAINYPKEARDRECQIRIAGCNFNLETTVLCHLPGGGIGRKGDDKQGAWGCSSCHDTVDGRTKSDYPPEMLRLYHLDGVIRTQEILISEGKL